MNFVDDNGYYTGGIPDEALKECSAQGSVDPGVEYWRTTLGFTVPRDLAIRYLREFGAWDDLDTVDQETLDRRVLWMACCDLKESGDWMGAVH